MKFGKLTDIENVDFRLPPDPAFNERFFEALPSNPAPLQFFTGCTGWSMKEWVGSVYPANARSKDFLRHYARQFNTIELNTTHYRIPTPETIQKWREESADDFKFCPKVPQTISHSRDLGLSDGQIALFCQSIAGLEEKLGCCFIQLPPYFDYRRLPLLESFLQRFSADIPLAVEARHESWFDNPQPLEDWLSCLHRNGRHTVLTDVAGRRDVLHMGLASDTVLIRFVGNDLHPTDYERVDAWIERLKDWRARGLRNVYFFTHEPDNLKAPELAAYLSQKLEAIPQAISRGPKIKDRPGKQMELF
jgi:uncharacterized protein YecE (DUF72 family)